MDWTDRTQELLAVVVIVPLTASSSRRRGQSCEGGSATLSGEGRVVGSETVWPATIEAGGASTA